MKGFATQDGEEPIGCCTGERATFAAQAETVESGSTASLSALPRYPSQNLTIWRYSIVEAFAFNYF